LFGCASSDYSFGAGFVPAVFVSLEDLQDFAVFVEEFYYAIVVPHKLTV
jgi:hypothetical protein